MEKHKDKINVIAIISSITAIISIITFFAKGFGTIALAQKDIDKLNDFQNKQEIINTQNVALFSTINTNIERIKSYLKTNLK